MPRSMKITEWHHVPHPVLHIRRDDKDAYMRKGIQQEKNENREIRQPEPAKKRMKVTQYHVHQPVRFHPSEGARKAVKVPEPQTATREIHSAQVAHAVHKIVGRGTAERPQTTIEMREPAGERRLFPFASPPTADTGITPYQRAARNMAGVQGERANAVVHVAQNSISAAYAVRRVRRPRQLP